MIVGKQRLEEEEVEGKRETHFHTLFCKPRWCPGAALGLPWAWRRGGAAGSLPHFPASTRGSYSYILYTLVFMQDFT